ncbi:MAG: ComF family protein [Bacteroidia bacterium]|nr:ComF family protein [Bacteroidia bacterium]
MLTPLLHLFFPRICVGCNGHLLQNEQHLCTNCMYHLPYTDYHIHAQNELDKTFWGRLPLIHAFAMVYFTKGGTMQHVLHEIKYRNNRELAWFMGNLYGNMLSQSGFNCDGIMAVPLHPKKLALRGYNQSEWIVKGMSEAMQKPNWSSWIARVKATETQTRKGRFARWQNVETVFEVTDATLLNGKHVLLIDDVITTGATLEACGKSIIQYPTTQLSIGALAFAHHH